MSVEWLWLGQAGFALRGAGRVVLIDPYLSDHLEEKYRGTDQPHDRLMPAPWRAEEVRGLTAVLCTHRHGDHMDLTALPILARHNPQCRFVVPRAELGNSPVAATGINAEETLVVDGIEIAAIASAHETLETNERGEHRFLGYVVRLEGTTIYHSGDCVPYEGLPERLRREQVDVALLPVNGRGKGVLGNFTFPEAVALCRAACIETLIVHHFGMFAFNTVARAELERQTAGTVAPPRTIVPSVERWNPLEINRKGEQQP